MLLTVQLGDDLKCTLSSLSWGPMPGEEEGFGGSCPLPGPGLTASLPPGLGEGDTHEKDGGMVWAEGPGGPRFQGEYALCHLMRASWERGEEVTVLRPLEHAMRPCLAPQAEGSVDSRAAKGVLAEEPGPRAGCSRGCRDRQVLPKGPG